jgi:hypothetical protein
MTRKLPWLVAALAVATLVVVVMARDGRQHLTYTAANEDVFAYGESDLQCDDGTRAGYVISTSPLDHAASPPTIEGDAPTTIPAPPSLQQVVDDEFHEWTIRYPTEPIGHLTYDIEEHADAAQIVGRSDGRIKLLSLVMQHPDGHWQIRQRWSCKELWRAA